MKQTLIDRRHLLKFLGGSALGTVLSPLPWKVLDDVSIWTQNWPWTPAPAKGETVIRHTTCALCPAGCGVKVRCVGAQPVGLFGLPGHPTSQGFLCPGGLLGHHLPYDAQRVTQPVRLVKARAAARSTAEQVLSELGKALARLKADPAAGRLAIIDSLPGRSTSFAYRRLASQFPGGAYILPLDPVRRSLRVFDGIAGDGYPELGIDVQRARTIVSFGADLLEGWGTPARFLKAQQASEQGPRLTQIEPRYSNTAAMADSWLPVRPGTEPILALGLAGLIVKENLFSPDMSSLISELNEIPDFRELLAALPPGRCGEVCGISPEAVAGTAREMGAHRPCLALLGANYSGGPFDENDHLAVNFLNLLVGAVGGEGALVPRRALPEIDTAAADLVSPAEFAQLPDQSIAFLVIDATVPRQPIPSALIRRKLVPDNPVVVCFSSSGTLYTDLSPYVLPVPLYLEVFEEIPTPSDSPVASFSFSVPLLSAPPAASSPVRWLSRLAQSARLDWPPLSADSLADSRIGAIWSCKRGSVYSYPDGTIKANSDLASADELRTAFRMGACWLDSPAEPVKPQLTKSPYFRAETWGRLKRVVNQRIEVVSKQTDDIINVMPFTTALATTLASPLAAKLTRESDLFAASGDALISPSTAGRLDLQEGQRAELETSKGRLPVRIRLDEAAVPGIIFVPVSDASATQSDPRNLCEISDDGVWRPTPAKLRRLDV